MVVNSKYLFRLEFNVSIFAEKFGSFLQDFSRRRNPAARTACGADLLPRDFVQVIENGPHTFHVNNSC